MASRHHRPVVRAASLAAALALAIPLAPLAASASKATTATTVRGTVVATNTARHTLVVAAGHTVDTVRFASASAVARIALGTRVTVRASRLADGTFRSLSLRARGRVRTAMVHGTVVSATATELLISGGGSVIDVNRGRAAVAPRPGRHAHSSSPAQLGAGADVSVDVSIQPTGLDATTVTQTGQSNIIDLEGVLSNVSATALTVTVENGAITTVQIPASIVIPSSIVAGDTVELLTAYANGSFTLVTITTDQVAATQTTQGVSQSPTTTGYIEAEGTVVAASATSLTIQPGDGAAPMGFVVPSTVSDAAAVVGTRIHVSATDVAGVLTLVSIQVPQSEGEGNGNGATTTQTEGLVVSVAAPTTSAAGTLVVQPGDSVAPISFVVPVGTDVSSIAVGSRVHVTGYFDTANANALTLQSFRVQQPEGDQGGQTNTVKTDGTVISNANGQLSLLPNDHATPLTFIVPATVDASAFIAGTQVTVVATLVNNALTVSSITSND